MKALRYKSLRRGTAPALRIAAIYAIVAGTWIFASDRLLGLLVQDPQLLTQIATYKGMGFVAITALMLYGLVQHAISRQALEAPSPGPQEDSAIPAPKMTWPILAFILLIAIIGGIGSLVVRHQKQGFLREEQSRLSTIAQFKAQQMDTWVETGIHQAEYAATRSILARTAFAWMRAGSPDDETRQQLQARMKDLLVAGQHTFVVMRNRQGIQQLQAGSVPEAPRFMEAARRAMDGGETLTIPEGPPRDPSLVHIFTPLTVPQRGEIEVIGCIHLAMDAERKLIPDLESALRDSTATETLLVGNLDGKPSLLKSHIKPLDTHLQMELLSRLPLGGEPRSVGGAHHLGAVAWSKRLPWGVLVAEETEVVYQSTQRVAWYVVLLGAVFLATGGTLISFWMRLQHRLYTQQQQRQTLENQLLEKRLDYLSRFANDIVLLMDEDGRLMDANDRACTAYGYTREELLALGIRDLRAPESLLDFQKQWERIRDAGSCVFETLHRQKDGTSFPVEVSSRRVEVQGRIMQQSIIRDISERKTAEEALRQAQKLESLGVLAGGIAHDFNNLLTAILGNLNLAQNELEGQHPAHAYLSNVEKTILKAVDLTRQMLAYSGKGRFIVKPNNLNRIINEMAELLRVSIPKKIELLLDLAPGLPQVVSDAAQIQQVVMNLVTNAADAIGERSGTIAIRSSAERLGEHQVPSAHPGEYLPPGPYIRIEVEDDGCGMSPEVIARVFDPFFSTKATGRGLGLSAMLGILRGHRAGLQIHSQPGKGSRFEIFLPASPESREEDPIEAHAAPLPNQGCRVLLVDDEPMIRETASLVLGAMGLDVTQGADGEEALELFQGQGVDLVVLDLTMPRMDGREAFRRMRELRPGMPIIVCSGYSEQESLLDAQGLPPTAFLPKPYSIKTLERLVADVLAMKA